MNQLTRTTTTLLATLILATPVVSAEASDGTAPEGLTAEAQEDGSLLLEWMAPVGVEFNVYRNGDLLATTDDPSYTDDQPEPVSEYFVTMVDSGGESDASESIFVIAVSSGQGSGSASPLLGNPIDFDAYGGIRSSCLPAIVTLALDTPPFLFVAINDRCLPQEPWTP